ncbi:Ca2+-transporting ATPase [Rhizobium sp. SG_E_25_P2]|uniref:cation-translocating P-type ATPase n=1 Tax=Rhizobium sp. SG_E_25_P2 TaxID=2879942 RepID=UPI0024739B5D|nr:HAD-IC family P-type ATPase [Rhizobium sp. SG_E_25_P2]MDH6266533.1 Ca2+-transporting ATPase [Rhizobium sp. SG_E_25_P2]
MDRQGLSEHEAAARRLQFGPNALPERKSPSFFRVFLGQFLSPLIYILLAAAALSVFLGDVEDAGFIGVVLLANGLIGAVQEFQAGKAAAALRQMEEARAIVIRDGERQELPARDLVPGDLVCLEAGGRVPADLRLIEVNDLRCDESLLTGEPDAVRKWPRDDDQGDLRASTAFSGSMVTRGRGLGEAVATGLATEFGKIAAAISGSQSERPPLLVRLERFSKNLAIAVLVAAVLLIAAGWLRGMPLAELFMVSVGLAVSAIPEGLPVAITVALAIAMRRMARRNVIMRNMPAIESLGSCTMIATDKTGTLTMNELTVTDILLPDGSEITLEDHLRPQSIEEEPLLSHAHPQARPRMARLLRAACLPNEASLVSEEEGWRGLGDSVDVALLHAARKGGLIHADVLADHPLLSRIPYEPDLKYAASFHDLGDEIRIFVKGAPETLAAMADAIAIGEDDQPIDRALLAAQKDAMAERGLRVLAFAEGRIASGASGQLTGAHLAGLTFLGLAGMKDPLRPEVPQAMAACAAAGIGVAMVTGDDPVTAAAIAREAGLRAEDDEIVTGPQLAEAEAKGPAAVDALTAKARIYARVEPLQKLAIVRSLARCGHIVAVTGDGVNDAPALKNAHVGVAMGRKGTDIARESADIIVTDDNFASIVAGVREGRVAFANIRKVIFMLVATGAAEVLLFLFTVPLGLPMPLLAVQLLWLNLVTNGVQDVALAAEQAEGDELAQPPRRPDEPIFDRVMIRRIVFTALLMGGGGFALYYWRLQAGAPIDLIRNELLLLFVMFENVLTLSARSERASLFGRRFFSNPLLLAGVAITQLLHVGAMYVPGLSDTLGVSPVTLEEWAMLIAPAAALLLALEVEKALRRRFTPRRGA